MRTIRVAIIEYPSGNEIKVCDLSPDSVSYLIKDCKLLSEELEDWRSQKRR